MIRPLCPRCGSLAAVVGQEHDLVDGTYRSIGSRAEPCGHKLNHKEAVRLSRRIYEAGPKLGFLHAEINVRTPQDVGEFAELAHEWLNASTRRLAAGPIQELAEGPPLPNTSLTRHTGAYGEYGTAWGDLYFSPADRRKQGSLYAWSPRAFEKMLGRLVEFPLGMQVEFSHLGIYGTPHSPGSGDMFVFQIERDYPGFKGWTRLVAYRNLLLGGDARERVAQEWSEFFENCVQSLPIPIGHGHLTTTTGNETASPFETVTRLSADDILGTDRIRRQGWLTVLSTAATATAGGMERIVRSGAFGEATPLVSGGVLLRATGRLADYTEDVEQRTLEALQSVLPSGIEPDAKALAARAAGPVWFPEGEPLPTETAQDQFHTMLRDHVSPALQARGFANGSGKYALVGQSGHIGYLEFVEDDTRTSVELMYFGIRVGVVSSYYREWCMLNGLEVPALPKDQADYDWTTQIAEGCITMDTDPERLSPALISLLDDQILPELQAGLEDEGLRRYVNAFPGGLRSRPAQILMEIAHGNLEEAQTGIDSLAEASAYSSTEIAELLACLQTRRK